MGVPVIKKTHSTFRVIPCKNLDNFGLDDAEELSYPSNRPRAVDIKNIYVRPNFVTSWSYICDSKLYSGLK